MELNIALAGMGSTAGLLAFFTARRIARDNQTRMNTALRVWLKWERARG